MFAKLSNHFPLTQNKNMKHYRQGDVLITRVKSIPAKAQKQDKSKAIILAHGEVTGHHHILQTRDPADWWKDGEISPALDKPAEIGGSIYVRLPIGAQIVHDEHGRINLPAGNYRVSRQREYSPTAIRNVID